jgi:hypothetical protein
MYSYYFRNAPRILVVHLKRFSYRNKYFREKLQTLVTYPLKGLDLTNHIIGPRTPAPIYDLYAVSNHYGSLGGGHYTAYALNKSTDKWYKFDDRFAPSPIPPSSIHLPSHPTSHLRPVRRVQSPWVLAWRPLHRHHRVHTRCFTTGETPSTCFQFQLHVRAMRAACDECVMTNI